MKFGGSSLGNTAGIKNVAKIVADYFQKKGDIVVIASAMGTVTDNLINCAQAAAAKNKAKYEKYFEILKKLHLKTAYDLKLNKASLKIVDEYFKELKEIADSICVLGEITRRKLDLVCSFGERLCVHLLAQSIKELGVKAKAIEASCLIVTDDNFGNANPNFAESEKKMQLMIPPLLKNKTIPVMTGFIGATNEGEVTTLGRGGSDFSATITGYCLDAKEVWIWTDVDGVMTADPRIVKDAKTIKKISYDEAAELSYFGAKVLHPRTIIPAALKNIPVWIKNTFKPEFSGTIISAYQNGIKKGVKAITTIKDLSLIAVEGRGMLGVPGTAAKVFKTLSEQNVNVMFISQASSEHNISFVVEKNDGEKAKKALEDTFQLELINKLIDKITIENDAVILAVVGEGMKGIPGIAGKTFSALGKNKINIMAIAQGSSELNISMVIKEEDLIKSVRAIHQAFQL